ncbi:MAG TPA: NDP-sugar synthase [Pyrinomonadaceae bacterium]|nr:NDP-sugar synthase [Pyrinomonadaceae bacterium]
MRAMILSAGYGTRLWPLTEDRTKPALPILGKPLVGYVAEYLAAFGCNEVLVNLHHRPESVRSALGDGSRFGVSLTYIEEPVILGTSGALDNARSLLEDDTFIVVNGKIITDIDLHAALETHRNTGALATMVLLPNPARERFSIVEVEDGSIKRFAGMPVRDDSSSSVPLMFTGIHIFAPRIFDYIPRGVFSDSVTHVYPQAIEKGERISAHVATGKWYELSTMQRYLEISLKLLAERGQTWFAGHAANIATGATVQNSILWDDVSVGEGASVNRAILADGVRIPAGETIENAVVVRAALVEGSPPPAKALPGEVRGENFVVSLTQ